MKKREKKKYIDEKRERKKDESPPRTFAHHHNQATVAAVSQLPSTQAVGRYTKVCKGNNVHQLLLTHVIFIRIKIDHANSCFLYLCSMLWFGCIHEYIHRLFKLSMVLRLK